MALEPTDTTLAHLDQSTDTVHLITHYCPVHFNENVYSFGIVANAGNSEFDTARAFERVGAVAETFIVNNLSPEADFFKYQGIVNADLNDVESHAIIERVIRQNGEDYRFEIAPNPVPALRDRKADNTDVGRVQGTEC